MQAAPAKRQGQHEEWQEGSRYISMNLGLVLRHPALLWQVVRCAPLNRRARLVKTNEVNGPHDGNRRRHDPGQL